MLCAYIIAVFAVTCAGLANGQLVTRFVPQRVDHFHPQDRREWSMRYFINNDNYQPGGPIFIYVGGGFEIFNQYLNRGLVHDIAVETQGMIFSTEQRFYGASRPTNDTSLESLRYLSIEQSVADIAYFIDYIKDLYAYARNAKVILYGKGQGAAIAVWARTMYPHLVDGVLASSANILSEVSHDSLFVNVGRTFRDLGGQECYDRIDRAFEQIYEQLNRGDNSGLTEHFRLCGDVVVDDDIYRGSFVTSMALRFEEFVEFAVSQQINAACDIIEDETIENDIEAVGNWLSNHYLNSLQCLDFNATAIAAKYSVVGWDTVSTIAGGRQDYYTRCVQLSNFPTMWSNAQPFVGGLDTEDFVTMCQRLFGAMFSLESVEETNRHKNSMFGGLRPNVRNVFFTHGEMDPMRTLGVREDLNEDAPAVVIPLVSRGQDLGSINENDSAELTATKRRARELIIQWITAIDGGELPPGPLKPVEEVQQPFRFIRPAVKPMM